MGVKAESLEYAQTSGKGEEIRIPVCLAGGREAWMETTGVQLERTEVRFQVH